MTIDGTLLIAASCITADDVITGEYLMMMAQDNKTIDGVPLLTCTGPGDDWMGCMIWASDNSVTCTCLSDLLGNTLMGCYRI